MKYLIYIAIICLIGGCSPSIYKTKTTISITGRSEKCVEFIDFVKNNMFYVEEDNSYLLSYAFQNVIVNAKYVECMSKFTFEEMISLFGKPSCQTEKCASYYFYQYIPNSVTYDELRINPDKFIFAFKKDDNSYKRVNKCDCEK
ncbi:MAG: hypothetical protein AB8G11_20535 [Saprospiraceae bacterium]